jgi:hypothetical protein
MRLDFNVLWIDDQPDRVRAQIKRIAVKMQEEGFDFNPTQCKSLEEVEAAIASEVFNDEIDLVLVDWDLGGEVEGQDAIVMIRDHIRYKDVVFYSAQTTPEELRKLAFDAGLEGVYCAARADLVDEVIGVFESLVKKVLDLDHVRGIVMGASSDIDNIVIECLTAMHGQLDDAGREKFIGNLLRRLKKRMKDLDKKASRLEEKPTIAAFFGEHLLITSSDRLKILSEALQSTEFKSHLASREAVIAYMEVVVPQRNILGHAVLVPEGKSKMLERKGSKSVSLQAARALRRQILTLRGEFRNLLSAIRGK